MFFDSIEHDRIYAAADFAKVFGIITGHDGVAHGYNNGLAVNASSGMDVTVGTGAAFIQGRLFEVYDQAETLTISPADLSNPRIDRVVVRLDMSFNGRTAQLVVKSGAPAAEPLPPALQRDESIWELSLAQIQVGAGVTSITADNIIDERSDMDACGYVDEPVTPESIGAETPGGAQAKVDVHANNKSNPHGVTILQIGAAPSGHEHTKSEITDFPSAMTPTAHQHQKADITDFPSTINPSAHKATHESGGSDAISNLATGATVAGNTIWHAGNDGSLSGLNADTVDGSHANTAIVANTIPVRDANGKIPGNITGSASNADTVDGKHASEIGGFDWVGAGATTLLQKSSEVRYYYEYPVGKRIYAIQLQKPGSYRFTGQIRLESSGNTAKIMITPYYISNPNYYLYASWSTSSTTFVSFSIDTPILPPYATIAIWLMNEHYARIRYFKLCCGSGTEPPLSWT
jgi:hypothetical protein